MASAAGPCAPISTFCKSGRLPSRSLLILLIVSALFVSLLLSNGCALLPRQSALPDPSVPHRVARETTVDVWVRRPDGQLVAESVRLLPGWWIASPQIVDPQPVKASP